MIIVKIAFRKDKLIIIFLPRTEMPSLKLLNLFVILFSMSLYLFAILQITLCKKIEAENLKY